MARRKRYLPVRVREKDSGYNSGLIVSAEKINSRVDTCN